MKKWLFGFLVAALLAGCGGGKGGAERHVGRWVNINNSHEVIDIARLAEDSYRIAYLDYRGKVPLHHGEATPTKSGFAVKHRTDLVFDEKNGTLERLVMGEVRRYRRAKPGERVMVPSELTDRDVYAPIDVEDLGDGRRKFVWATDPRDPNATQSGVKFVSSSVEGVIHCKEKTLEMGRAKYFDGKNATGKIVLEETVKQRVDISPAKLTAYVLYPYVCGSRP